MDVLSGGIVELAKNVDRYIVYNNMIYLKENESTKLYRLNLNESDNLKLINDNVSMISLLMQIKFIL